MEKQDIIKFFNKLAQTWDAEMIRDDTIINVILDNAHVTAIDISSEMAKIAAEKYAGEKVCVLCGDVETEVFEQKFLRSICR